MKNSRTRGEYSPRDYQQRSIQAVRKACAQGKRTILVLPTGGGKTKTAVYGIVKQAVAKGAKVLWMAHRSELIAQADGDLVEAGVRTGLIKAGVREDRTAPCQVASIQTLARRDLPEARIVIVDECHHVRSATYMRVIEHYQEAGSIIVGLTATPERLDGKGLGDVFDEIVEEVTVRELIDRDFLADYDYFAPSIPDLDGVPKQGGDFHKKLTGQLMNRPTITGNLLTHYVRHMSGKRALLFAAGIAHSMAVVEAFKAAGVPAAHLDGSSPAQERSDILAKFESGEVLVVSNVDLFDEGFDVPACQGVMIARPTQSFVKHRQMIGRCLRRKADGSRAVVLDHAGNFLRHGMPDDITDWKLADKPTKTADAPKHKQCPKCFAVLPVHVAVCPCCGHRFGTKPRTGPDMVGGDLQKVKQKKWTTQEKEALYTSLMGKARALGYAPGWAKHQYKAKVKVWPRGFTKRVDRVSFDACDHVKVSAETNRCNHCGAYRGPDAGGY